MRRLNSNSKTPLLLMEMILSLLILSLAAAACIRIFAAAYENRRQAREWNHIQELTVSMSEIWECSDGSTGIFAEHLPGGTATGNLLSYYYDEDWKPCPEGTHTYRMTAGLSTDRTARSMELSFYDSKGHCLYQVQVRFPVLQVLEEEAGA